MLNSVSFLSNSFNHQLKNKPEIKNNTQTFTSTASTESKQTPSLENLKANFLSFTSNEQKNDFEGAKFPMPDQPGNSSGRKDYPGNNPGIKPIMQSDKGKFPFLSEVKQEARKAEVEAQQWEYITLNEPGEGKHSDVKTDKLTKNLDLISTGGDEFKAINKPLIEMPFDEPGNYSGVSKGIKVIKYLGITKEIANELVKAVFSNNDDKFNEIVEKNNIQHPVKDTLIDKKTFAEMMEINLNAPRMIIDDGASFKFLSNYSIKPSNDK